MALKRKRSVTLAADGFIAEDDAAVGESPGIEEFEVEAV
jgi:hypothetical protein